MVIVQFGPGQRAICDGGVWRATGELAAEYVARAAYTESVYRGYDPDPDYTAAKALIALVGQGRIVRRTRTPHVPGRVY